MTIQHSWYAFRRAQWLWLPRVESLDRRVAKGVTVEWACFMWLVYRQPAPHSAPRYLPSPDPLLPADALNSSRSTMSAMLSRPSLMPSTSTVSSIRADISA